ncbi:MAG TPA: metallophosphoesterase [Acidimicrobiales bacterium]
MASLEPPHRIAVIGDVGGHMWMLRRCLRELEADTAAGIIPDDLVVIQVGDLVHRGPDSTGVVALVDRMMAGSPGQWVQLIGNHEAQEGLGGPDFWQETVTDDVRADLRRWLDGDQLRLAVALDTVEYGPVLLSHAGLTRQKWVAIGRPEDPETAAATLNKELAIDPELAFVAGEMLGVRPRLPVGVAWASARELLQSWDMEQLPFSQVHGHASPRRWSTDTWAPGLSHRITARASADPEKRHSDFLWPDGEHILCVDPDYGADAAPVPLSPLILNGEVLTTAP